MFIMLICFQASDSNCSDLCPKHNSDCWQLMFLSCTCRAGCLDNIVLACHVMIIVDSDSFLSGQPDFALTYKAVMVYPQISPCLEHVCGGGVTF